MDKKYDEMAWKSLHERKTFPEDTFGPLNYIEMEEQIRSGVQLEIAFAHLLDHFYRSHNPSTFEFEPSTFFSVKRRAFYAGVAEFLLREFGLPIPAWTEKPEFFLNEPWDPEDEFRDEFFESKCPIQLTDRLASATYEFSRRNVAFQARGLIRL